MRDKVRDKVQDKVRDKVQDKVQDKVRDKVTLLAQSAVLCAVGLWLAVGPAVAAENSAWNRAHGGAAPERKTVFADPLVVTNPPASPATPDQLGPLIEPRLVTNAGTHLPAGLRGTAPANALPPSWGQDLQALDSKQKLLEGDRVIFRVLEDQEDPKVLTLTDAGQLDVPELGLVSAKNKTCKELAAEIKRKLEQTTYLQATVILAVHSIGGPSEPRGAHRIYVGGLVQRPGQQEIPAGESWTVTKAIMRAGGFAQYANRHKVKVVRAGKAGAPAQSFDVDVGAVLEKGRTEQDRPLEAEDFIWVRPQGWSF